MSKLLRRASLAEDRELIARCAAAAALAGVESPNEWAQQNAWQFAITDGWDVEGPSGQTISDAAVIARVAELTGSPPPEPEPDPCPDPDPAPLEPGLDGDDPVPDTESPA